MLLLFFVFLTHSSKLIFSHSAMSLYSTQPQSVQTGSSVCIPASVTSLKAILLSPSATMDNGSPTLKSMDGTAMTITFFPRAHLYVHLWPSSLNHNNKCFQVDLNSLSITGQIQFIYEFNSIVHSTVSSTIDSNLNIATTISTPVSFTTQAGSTAFHIDACLTRRIKCKNGGTCQLTVNGQTVCICPDHVSGTDCERIGIRCGDVVCVNQANCSTDGRSCVCRLGTQGRDCSIRCGEPHIQPNLTSDRIVNGEPAVKNSWPYLVYIQIGATGWCGGSLIDPWNILTAAHCTYGRESSEFIAWIGVHRLSERENEMNMGIVQRRLITQIINHPHYSIHPIKTYANDVSLLRLAEEVKESAYIRYLCVIPTDSRMNDVQLHDQIEIVGWGYINKILSDGSNIHETDELQQATIQILPDTDCLEYRRGEEILFQSTLMICAGSIDYKTDSCQGDSGGPLMIKQNERWFALGLVSFGSVECAKQGAAGVYTRLSIYSSWIFKHIEAV